MEKQIPLIIDTDPGVDDMLALRIALCSDAFDVRLVCSVAGNVSLDLTTANALYLTKIWGGDIPVCRGTASPLNIDASDVHGAGGLGKFRLPSHSFALDPRAATEAMFEALTASDEKLTFVTLGPLTNVAKLLREHPEISACIERIYAMIASKDGTGNITPFAEFNAYCDPAALDTVIRSGVEIVFAPMHLGHEAKLPMAAILSHAAASERQRLQEVFNGYYDDAVGAGYIAMYDANAVEALLHPELYNFVRCVAEVNLSDRPGQTFLRDDPSGHCYRLEIKDRRALIEAMLSDLLPDSAS